MCHRRHVKALFGGEASVPSDMQQPCHVFFRLFTMPPQKDEMGRTRALHLQADTLLCWPPLAQRYQ